MTRVSGKVAFAQEQTRYAASAVLSYMPVSMGAADCRPRRAYTTCCEFTSGLTAGAFIAQ
jgi:hypothetical protein